MTKIGKKIETLLSAATFAEAGEQDVACSILRGDRSIVLAITRGQDAMPAVRYAVNAARRNTARLDILLIDDVDSPSGSETMVLSGELRTMVSKSSVPFREIACAGPVPEALRGHAGREKNVLFFIADPAGLGTGGQVTASSMNRLAETLGRPIVQVGSVRMNENNQGKREKSMATSVERQKPVGKMLVMGFISIALYTYLLSNQDLVNGTFGKGGWYALLPIIVAFVFSFVHGTFTSDFWTVLGVEAARKKKEVK